MLAWLAVTVAVLLGILSSAVLIQRAVKERRETERVRSVFSRYVSPYVVEELLARKDPRLFEGRAGNATILFCRIWNFALFTEKLDPGETLRYLNEFYTLAGQAIHKNRGMIDKFLGEGIMAVFGMPLDDPHQEEHAINTALDIVRLVSAMNGRWVAQGRKPFRIGIGINSGNVIAGDTGFARRREYTVVGNEVIIASRLQELTEQFGAFILTSSATYDVVSEMFAAIPIKNIPLRGMQRVQTAYVIRGLARHGKDDTLLLPPPYAFRRTILSERETVSSEPQTPAPAPATASAASEAVAAAEAVGSIATPVNAEAAHTAVPANADVTSRREKKPRRLVTKPNIEQDLDRDRFDTPSPQPRKNYLGRSWIPPQQEYRPAKLTIPEVGEKHHSYESAEPAMPELPAPPMTYEDQHGPPMELPP